MAGIAPIKAEFLRPPPRGNDVGFDGGDKSDLPGTMDKKIDGRKIEGSSVEGNDDSTGPTNNDEEIANPSETASFRCKRTAEEKKKMRGQNKKRPRPQRPNDSERLCPHIQNGKQCPFGDDCRYDHDIEGFWSLKLPDLADRCPNYEEFGVCKYGFSCRFAGAHVDPTTWKNLEKPVDPNPVAHGERNEMNRLGPDLQKILRQKNYDFQRSVAISAAIGRNSGPSSTKGSDETVLETVNPKMETGGGDVNADLGRELRVPSRRWDGLLYLAPLTTVGNLPFRRVCKGFGAEITCGEMAMAQELLDGRSSEWALVKRHSSEAIFGVQVCGSHVDMMTKCAQLLTDQLDIDFIDVNLGCPIDLVCGKGAGCSLMNRHNRLEQILRSMRRVMPENVALTVKMRTGYYENKSVAHLLAPKLADMGVSLFTLHGRSREQRYTKSPNWQYIYQCAKAASPLPCFGCGDVLSYEEYYQHLDQLSEATKTDSGDGSVGIMMARGALIKPWIFTEIKERRHWDISAGERLDILKQYVDYGLQHWGSDQQGVNNTRRFLLEWLSFLHRYIPVGVLERLPQRINDRPPSFVCRNDLESLFASRNCADWIKITEMLLGPVPDGFSFLPKHKANSYQ